jgi:hypothetical protein
MALFPGQLPINNGRIKRAGTGIGMCGVDSCAQLKDPSPAAVKHSPATPWGLRRALLARSIRRGSSHLVTKRWRPPPPAGTFEGALSRGAPGRWCSSRVSALPRTTSIVYRCITTQEYSGDRCRGFPLRRKAIRHAPSGGRCAQTGQTLGLLLRRVDA